MDIDLVNGDLVNGEDYFLILLDGNQVLDGPVSLDKARTEGQRVIAEDAEEAGGIVILKACVGFVQPLANAEPLYRD